MKGSERAVGFGSWRLDATDTEPEDVDSQVSEILAKLTSNLGAWTALGSFASNSFADGSWKRETKASQYLPAI
jgi:hypothetical protein